MPIKNNYKLNIGLEIHVELKSEKKLFCGCPAAYGSAPNTAVCPVCSGEKSAKLVYNESVTPKALRAGLALECSINKISAFDRKHYSSPDLPKGYQLTQYYRPICENGFLQLDSGKKVKIERIHIEEDAGRIVGSGENSFVDLNRCGVPLIEIVSEPWLESADEAVEFAEKLRKILIYAGVSDCKMNEGAFRVDINISVRKSEKSELGVRCEIKNLNSFRNIRDAINYEFERQSEIICSGGVAARETRRFDEADRKTYSSRVKESAEDYSYTPDLSLPPLELNEKLIEKQRRTIPPLPQTRLKLYCEQYGVELSSALLLIAERETADFFEAAAKMTEHKNQLARLIISELLPTADMSKLLLGETAARLAEICGMLCGGEINYQTAKKLIALAAADKCDDVKKYAEENNMLQLNDEALLREIVKQALASEPKSAEAYKNGKSNAYNAVFGSVMKLTKGRGNPEIVNRLLRDELKTPEN